AVTIAAGLTGKARIAAQEPDVAADPPQPHQGLADTGLVDVASAVDEKAVPADPISGRAGLDPGQVDRPGRELAEDVHQRPGMVVGQEGDDRGPVRPGDRGQPAGPG